MNIYDNIQHISLVSMQPLPPFCSHARDRVQDSMMGL